MLLCHVCADSSASACISPFWHMLCMGRLCWVDSCCGEAGPCAPWAAQLSGHITGLPRRGELDVSWLPLKQGLGSVAGLTSNPEGSAIHAVSSPTRLSCKQPPKRSPFSGQLGGGQASSQTSGCYVDILAFLTDIRSHVTSIVLLVYTY